MTKRTLALAATIALCFVAPFAALAAGPLDGSYAVTETFPDGQTASYYILAVENGPQAGFAMLFSNGTWAYGSGAFNVDGVIQGTLYTSQHVPYGAFEALFLTDGRIVAGLNVGGVTSHVDGQRFF